MEDLNSINKRPHKVTLLGRRTCNLTGVNDVLSFDEREVILETEQGMLMMKGSLTALPIPSRLLWRQKANPF